MPLTGLVRIPAGDLLMGGSSEQIEACIANWATRLVDPSDDLARFRQRILKEHPRHLARVTGSRLGRAPSRTLTLPQFRYHGFGIVQEVAR